MLQIQNNINMEKNFIYKNLNRFRELEQIKLKESISDNKYMYMYLGIHHILHVNTLLYFFIFHTTESSKNITSRTKCTMNSGRESR